jgi:hypothetical protein
MIEPTFRPIADKGHFPILAAGGDLPCAHLVGCIDLVFYAPDDLVSTYPVIAQEGVQWHLYGDTRWPSPAAWVEFDTGKIGYAAVGLRDRERGGDAQAAGHRRDWGAVHFGAAVAGGDPDGFGKQST